MESCPQEFQLSDTEAIAAEKTESKVKRSALSSLLENLKALLDSGIPVEDRRSCGRMPCLYRITFIGESGRTGAGDILNVSRSGLLLRSDGHLTRGRTLALNPPSEERVDAYPPLMAKVVWTRREVDGSVLGGLTLPPSLTDESTWLEVLLKRLGYTSDASQKRRFIRVDAEFPALWRPLEDGSAELREVTVSNLGMGGALISSERAIPSGDPFLLVVESLLDLPRIELPGRVLRNTLHQDSGRTYHSCQFDKPPPRTEGLLRDGILKLLNSR